jgi:opacity protein-like surface antigen
MKTLKTLQVTLAAIAALCALQAQAADTAGGYLLAGVGQGKYNEDCTGVANCSTTATASKLVGGYRFGNGVAAEALYINFGKIGGDVGAINVNLRATAVGVGAAVYTEFAPKWLGTLRVGLAQVKVKANGSFAGVSASDSESSTKAYFGLGLGYAFTDTMYAELGFDGTQGKYGGENESIQAWTVGLGVRF